MRLINIRNVLFVVLAATGPLYAQVSNDRILRAAQEPQNWLTHHGNYNSQRYSTLSQITAENVKNLEVQWIFQARSLEKFEATPLVVDGIMYTVQAPNDIVALDAATGRLFWTYSPPPMTKPGRKTGASTPFRVPVNPDTRPGRRTLTRGNMAAPRFGSRVPTIRI